MGLLGRHSRVNVSHCRNAFQFVAQAEEAEVVAQRSAEEAESARAAMTYAQSAEASIAERLQQMEAQQAEAHQPTEENLADAKASVAQLHAKSADAHQQIKDLQVEKEKLEARISDQQAKACSNVQEDEPSTSMEGLQRQLADFKQAAAQKAAEQESRCKEYEARCKELAHQVQPCVTTLCEFCKLLIHCAYTVVPCSWRMLREPHCGINSSRNMRSLKLRWRC